MDFLQFTSLGSLQGLQNDTTESHIDVLNSSTQNPQFTGVPLYISLWLVQKSKEKVLKCRIQLPPHLATISCEMGKNKS